MKKIIIPIFTVILTSLFSSCDYVKDPLQSGVQTIANDSLTVRRVLIEEFTGHYCSNCPEAATEANRLVGVYGSQIIPIAIHAGDPAFNDPHPGTGMYETDFTTSDGDAYATGFSLIGQGLPNGIVSRLNNASLVPFANWETEFLTVKNLAPVAEINITSAYNTSNREVTIDVETEWLLDGETGTNYSLQVWMIEDHIIDWQYNLGVNDPNYEHRHVFRGAVNTTWGEAIATTTQGSKDNKSYTYTLNAAWDEDNCEIVAFVYKDSPDYEIMQANIEHVK